MLATKSINTLYLLTICVCCTTRLDPFINIQKKIQRNIPEHTTRAASIESCTTIRIHRDQPERWHDRQLLPDFPILLDPSCSLGVPADKRPTKAVTIQLM
eukprot:GHVU01192698.1.p1 GENE.GHVU01192698.1~~GHVU01192698.1.p1  ORF type:complete len:100 (-),score=1.65 GHVU01192698.1:29-328(-)